MEEFVKIKEVKVNISDKKLLLVTCLISFYSVRADMFLFYGISKSITNQCPPHQLVIKD